MIRRHSIHSPAHAPRKGNIIPGTRTVGVLSNRLDSGGLPQVARIVLQHKHLLANCHPVGPEGLCDPLHHLRADSAFASAVNFLDEMANRRGPRRRRSQLKQPRKEPQVLALSLEGCSFQSLAEGDLNLRRSRWAKEGILLKEGSRELRIFEPGARGKKWLTALALQRIKPTSCILLRELLEQTPRRGRIKLPVLSEVALFKDHGCLPVNERWSHLGGHLDEGLLVNAALAHEISDATDHSGMALLTHIELWASRRDLISPESGALLVERAPPRKAKKSNCCRVLAGVRRYERGAPHPHRQ
mmetsp:Transcript_11294/g.34826  ORF Transcript_11294/g.34826 Transcript_11294/m.34826 type:complete len:301 (-) Transcript_11294:1645-2547(-)